MACGEGDRVQYPVLPGVEVWIEKPQAYPGSKVDPNDLITLALHVGRLQERWTQRGHEVHLVLPRVWKGQVPKTVHHARVRASLTPHEFSMLRGMSHNVWDAVALAKWAYSQSRRG